jgi:uridine kinase
MHTIRLRVNDKVYKHLIKILSKFSKEEIQVIAEDETFISIQQYFEKEIAQVEDGSAEYIDIDELNNHLDDTIRKYED